MMNDEIEDDESGWNVSKARKGLDSFEKGVAPQVFLTDGSANTLPQIQRFLSCSFRNV